MPRKPDADPAMLRRLAAALFGTAVLVDMTRTPDGVSTQVYRVRRGRETFYLRLAEEAEDSLEPEALVHERLRRCGAKVPAIVALVPFDEGLGRSVMVTTAIPGAPLSHATDPATARRVIAAAGSDLAIINDLALDGFGWVRRDPAARDRLAAEHATWAAFVADDWAPRLTRVEPLLGTALCREIDGIVTQTIAAGGPNQGQLVHGDFDLSHIFYEDGVYTGIIDFGEIRGADRRYDLAHFALHERDRLPFSLFPNLRASYEAVHPLPATAGREIAFWAVVIGVHRLALSIGRRAPAYQRFLIGAVRRMSNLATDGP